MDGLSSPLSFTLLALRGLQSGLPLQTSIKTFVTTSTSKFSLSLGQQLIRSQNSLHFIPPDSQDPLWHALFDITWRGLHGESVAKQLEDLLFEIEQRDQIYVDDFVSKLPTKAMIPVVLVMFPAFLILLLGPIALDLLRSFQ